MKIPWKTIFVAFVVALVSCGPNLAARKLTTNIDGLPVDLGSLTGGCGSVGIGTRPTQADIDLCKSILDPTARGQLQILWEEFDNVLTDGIHSVSGKYGGTCPILVLFPIQDGHKKGTISDEEFAKKIHRFYCAKYLENLDGSQAKAKARLTAEGLPLP